MERLWPFLFSKFHHTASLSIPWHGAARVLCVSLRVAEGLLPRETEQGGREVHCGYREQPDRCGHGLDLAIQASIHSIIQQPWIEGPLCVWPCSGSGDRGCPCLQGTHILEQPHPREICEHICDFSFLRLLSLKGIVNFSDIFHLAQYTQNVIISTCSQY